MWPKPLYDILSYYFFEIQEKDIKKELSTEQKRHLVSELILAYNSLSNIEKSDVLIPAKSEFLENHAIKADEVGSHQYRFDLNYKWPPNDGFEGARAKVILKPNCEYDRIGSPRGVFIAPIPDSGIPASFLSRAIPYYIPEKNIADSPAYHRYRVGSQYSGIGSSEKESVLQGVIAHAFWCNPDDGGGTQLKLPERITALGGVLNEVKENP